MPKLSPDAQADFGGYSPDVSQVLSAYCKVVLDDPLGYKAESCIAAVLRAAANHCTVYAVDKLHLRAVAAEIDPFPKENN
jgi:hypothetical protein